MEALDLLLALLLWPVAVAAMLCLFLWKNGGAVATRFGRPLHRQVIDQLRLYLAAGILPPMYYVYELYRRPVRRHARSFLLRAETKAGVYNIVNREQRLADSIANDKAAFAEHFVKHGIPVVPTLAVFRSGEMFSDRPPEDFRSDLFVKLVVGKGGWGAQRWDYLEADHYQSAGGPLLDRQQLFERWRKKSERKPLLVQPRVLNHPDLLPINNGALSTVRVLTCLDEQRRPELVGAVLRMAVGSNRVVDNAHAGGIAAAVDLETGRLAAASNLGTDARAGWVDRHPSTGAQITRVELPCWRSLRSLVKQAHACVHGAVVLAWDVAITPEGPLLIEVNCGPGLEIMQRAHRRGFARGRLGDLLAYHVSQEPKAPARFSLPA